MRLVIVVMFLCASVGVISVIFLFPAFMYATVEEKSALADVATVKDMKPDPLLVTAKQELTAAKDMATALDGPLHTFRLSAAIQAILAIRKRITITSVSVVRATPNVTISIQGIAPTRDDLLAFQSDISLKIPGGSADIPPDLLLQNKDVHFSLKINAQFK